MLRHERRIRRITAAALLSGAVLAVPVSAQSVDPASTQVENRMTTGTVSDLDAPTDHAPLTKTVAARGNGAPAAAVQMTRDNGAPIGENRNSKAAGDTGPVLLEDTTLIEKLARFDREREPERVVHARGTGAEGVFVASKDISEITKASLFTPGKETPVFVRFSTVIHPSGSPEALRDPRGFAVKFYTDQGN